MTELQRIIEDAEDLRLPGSSHREDGALALIARLAREVEVIWHMVAGEPVLETKNGYGETLRVDYPLRDTLGGCLRYIRAICQNAILMDRAHETGSDDWTDRHWLADSVLKVLSRIPDEQLEEGFTE